MTLTFLRQHPLFVFFIILASIIAGFTGKAYLEKQTQQTDGRRGSGVTKVAIHAVETATIVDELEAIGTAKANESISLTSKVTDNVNRVNFEDGMYVAAGKILVELTNSEETALLAETQAAVDESTRQFERVKNLINQKLASETQLDIETARMQSANARLEAVSARLDDRLIRAPFSGVLGFRNISPGTLLSPNTVVTTLDDISIIKLDFSIPENYLAILAKGQEVIARSSAYPDKIFIGEVQNINSRVDPVTRSVAIRAHLNNDARLLRPGMLLTVHLVRNKSTALIIPEEAVIPIRDKIFVYVVEDGTAQQVEIEAGRRRPGIIEVLSGLNEGQLVITQGVIKVNPGSKVEVQ